MNVTIGGIARTVEITSFDKLGDVKVCMLTTTADGSVGFQQLNQEVIDMIYASFPVDTAEGPIASFEDGADNVPVRELKLNLEPYQNLNGYDSPWVGGAGKNKLALSVGAIKSANTSGTWSGNAYTLNNVTFTLQTNSIGEIVGINVNGTANAETVLILLAQYVDYPFNGYVLNGCPSGGGNSTYVLRVSDITTTSSTDYGSGVTTSLAATGRWQAQILVRSGATMSNKVFYPIIRLSTESADFTPYSNICPIYPANGKNLLDTESFVAGCVNSTGGITPSGASIVSKDNGIVKFTATGAWEGVSSDFFPVYGGYSYYVSNADTVAYYIIGWYDGSKTFISRETQNASTGIIKATSPSGAKYARVSFQEATAGTWEISKLQFEFGGAHTAYVPYESLSITRTGKNLLGITTDGKTESGITIRRNSNGSITVNGTVSSWNVALRYALGEVAVPYYLYKGQTYTFSGFVGYSSSAAYAQLIYVGDETGTTYSIVIANGPVTRTMTENAHIQDVHIVFCVGTSFNNVTFNLQLEVGSSATAYEPYTADRYYIDSSTPIYGGTLEVETGLLTVTKGYKVLDGSESWSWNTGRGAPFTPVSGGIITNAVTQYNTYVNSDKFKPVSWAVAGSADNCVAMYYGGSYVLFKNTSVFTDAATAKAWFANNPTQVTYELATPQTYQLTPTQVKTLLGYNNIWTDSGTVEVQYLANIGLYIQKIIGATEDDMVANQNISANKYFFVGEELYYSTSAISAGQTIVVGTNCIKTNLADALNALNS